LSALPACKKSGAPGAGSAAPSGATPSGPTAEGSADEVEGEKLSAAIECLNRHSGRVFEARDTYLEGVDAATGSSHGKKAVMIGLYGSGPCVSEVKKAGALKPAVPALDTASAAYASALEGLVKVYEELSGYYQKGEHIDDGGKKAAALHPKVMDAFKTFGAAHKQLSTTVKALNRKRREAKLAAREKAEGRNLGVIMDAMMLEAEMLVSMPSPDVAPAALEAQIAAYGKLVDEVDAYAGAHKDEASKWGSIDNIKNYDKTFLAATKVVARKRRDSAAPSDSELEAVPQQYNSLVDNYNRH
jgi:hypothetical protein